MKREHIVAGHVVFTHWPGMTLPAGPLGFSRCTSRSSFRPARPISGHEAYAMTRWPRALLDAIWADAPTAREAALVAGFVLVVPFGWLALLVRPVRRVLRSH